MRSKGKRHSSSRLGRHKKTKQGSLKPCPAGSSRNPKTKRCKKDTDTDIMKKPCPPGKKRNPQTKRCRLVSPTKPKTLKALPENQEYNIYIICKNKEVFKERKEMLDQYKGTKIHKFYYVPAVFLKDTEANRKKTQKLQTMYNTKMKSRLRKLGCIFAHRNALRAIVKNKTNQNVILEEDATLDHVLPKPPDKSAYLGGWIIPPQITLAGKKKVHVPHLTTGLNEIKYGTFSVLMAHAYYMKTHEKAKEILDSIEGPEKVRNYDVHLIKHKFLKDFYYPAIFVQGKHVSDIDGKVNINDRRTKNYGLDLVS